MYPRLLISAVACCRSLWISSSAADMDRKSAVVDGKDRQTDGRTDGRPTITQTLFRTLLAIGATTAEKLEGTSRGVDANPLHSPPGPFPVSR